MADLPNVEVQSDRTSGRVILAVCHATSEEGMRLLRRMKKAGVIRRDVSFDDPACAACDLPCRRAGRLAEIAHRPTGRANSQWHRRALMRLPGSVIHVLAKRT